MVKLTKNIDSGVYEKKNIYFPSSLSTATDLSGKAYIKFEPKLIKILKKSEKEDFIDTIELEQRLENASLFDERDNKLIGSMILPIRKINDAMSADYRLMKGLDLLAGGKPMQYALWNFPELLKAAGGINNTLGGIGNFISGLPEEVKAAFRAYAGEGFMENPHDMMIYNGNSRRSFNIDYNVLKPQNKEDEDNLKLIKKIFRMSQLTDYDKDLFSAASPTSWYISFYSFPHADYDGGNTTNINPFLSINNAGLRGFNIPYGDNGVNDKFTRMKSGEPLTSMNLSFVELDRMDIKSKDYYGD
jgi:hypothetical protein